MANINPRVDIAFKKIFGVEENKDLLLSLINSIMAKEDQVNEIQLLNPYNIKNFKKDKLSILDLKAKSTDGRRFNIEIQVTDEADYDKRALYYWAKLYTEQLKENDSYSKLCKAVGIHILNFISIPQNNKYHNIFHITEKETGIKYFDNLELHTIELKKFAPDNQMEEMSELVKKIKTSLDIWLAFLTRHDLLNNEKLPKKLANRDIKKALTILKKMNLNDEERLIYQDHLDWLRIEASALKKQEMKGRIKGEKIGLEKGEKIGIEKGEKIGLEKGEKIGIEKHKIDIAKKMKTAHMSEATIQQITGLSLEEIKKI